MQKDPVQEISKRTQRYWFEDGIWEIGFGLVNAFLGVFYLVTAQIHWEGPLSIFLMLLQMGVLISCFALINRVVVYLKERITYPRTGYVAYRKPAVRARIRKIFITMLLSAGIASLVGVVSALQMTENRMPLVISVILAGTLVYIGYRFDLIRLYLTALLVVLYGYGISHYTVAQSNSTGVFFTGFGLLIFISGLLTLFNYLRRTRPMNQADDYEAPAIEAGSHRNDEN